VKVEVEVEVKVEVKVEVAAQCSSRVLKLPGHLRNKSDLKMVQVCSRRLNAAEKSKGK